ncbi:putative signal peptide protein [Puccinia sorghi]|uniref:Putative signal peptide protein n=1 Tax=Puccinia sorghi TaxID=27349 RepID=A0A0L6VME3_9BASI|nr:putative signal peptide protein [Puccinia sorghi]
MFNLYCVIIFHLPGSHGWFLTFDAIPSWENCNEQTNFIQTSREFLRCLPKNTLHELGLPSGNSLNHQLPFASVGPYRVRFIVAKAKLHLHNFSKAKHLEIYQPTKDINNMPQGNHTTQSQNHIPSNTHRTISSTTDTASASDTHLACYSKLTYFPWQMVLEWLCQCYRRFLEQLDEDNHEMNNVGESQSSTQAHQGIIPGTSLSSAIAYIPKILSSNHVVCWLHESHIYAAKNMLKNCGNNVFDVAWIFPFPNNWASMGFRDLIEGCERIFLLGLGLSEMRYMERISKTACGWTPISTQKHGNNESRILTDERKVGHQIKQCILIARLDVGQGLSQEEKVRLHDVKNMVYYPTTKFSLEIYIIYLWNHNIRCCTRRALKVATRVFSHRVQYLMVDIKMPSPFFGENMNYDTQHQVLEIFPWLLKPWVRVSIHQLNTPSQLGPKGVRLALIANLSLGKHFLMKSPQQLNQPLHSPSGLREQSLAYFDPSTCQKQDFKYRIYNSTPFSSRIQTRQSNHCQKELEGKVFNLRLETSLLKGKIDLLPDAIGDMKQTPNVPPTTNSFSDTCCVLVVSFDILCNSTKDVFVNWLQLGLMSSCSDSVLTVLLRAVSFPCHQNLRQYFLVTGHQLQEEGFHLSLKQTQSLGESGSRSGSSFEEEKERLHHAKFNVKTCRVTCS